MSKEAGYKVSLSSGKTVLLREYKIKHQRLAAQAASARMGDNAFVAGIAMAEELLKLLIVQIDEKVIPAMQLEDLDSCVSPQDYAELQKVVSKLVGGQVHDPKVEFVSTGD